MITDTLPTSGSLGRRINLALTTKSIDRRSPSIRSVKYSWGRNSKLLRSRSVPEAIDIMC